MLEIRKLAGMSLMKRYFMLQNPRSTTFTVFELLKENQPRSKNNPTPPRLGLTYVNLRW